MGWTINRFYRISGIVFCKFALCNICEKAIPVRCNPFCVCVCFPFSHFIDSEWRRISLVTVLEISVYEFYSTIGFIFRLFILKFQWHNYKGKIQFFYRLVDIQYRGTYINYLDLVKGQSINIYWTYLEWVRSVREDLFAKFRLNSDGKSKKFCRVCMVNFLYILLIIIQI